MRFWSVLPLLAAFSMDAVAGERPPKPEMRLNLPGYSLDTRVFDFPTGLRIMFQADNSYPVVSLYMIVNHGSADDPPGKDETAHFVEHTWFRSVHGDLPPIMTVVNDISGVFNASTWNDWTNYSTVASAEFLPFMLQLESLRLTDFYRGMTEDQTDTEREVIRNEWRRRNENNTALLFDYMYNVVYPKDHPYSSTSTHETIDSIRLADLQKYADDYYKPHETTIMVVGDFDAQTASSLIFENFDLKLLHPKLTEEMLFRAPRPGISKPDPDDPTDWVTGAWDPDEFLKGRKVPFRLVEPTKVKQRVTADRAGVPALGDKTVHTEQAPIERPMALVGFSLPGGYRDDHLEIQVLGNLVSLVVTSGLYSVYSQSQIPEVGCFTQAEVVNSTLMCLAEIRDKDLKPEDVMEKILDQFILLWDPEQRPALEREFSRARNEFLANELLGLDTIASIFGGRADNIGTWAHLTGSQTYYSDLLASYGELTPGPIIDLAYKYLKRDRAARLIVKPLPEDDIDTTSAESGYIGASRGDDVAQTSDDLKSVTDADIAATRVKPDLSKMVDKTLPNGLRVVVYPHGEAPMVQSSMIFGGGDYTLPDGMFDFMTTFHRGPGNDPLAIASTANWPSIQGINGIFSAFSLPLATSTSYGNAWRLDFSSPSGNLDQALWILRDEIENVTPYTSGSAEWKKDAESSMTRGWNRKEWHMGDIVAQHLYPGAPWHQYMSPSALTTMQAHSASSLTATLQRHIQPGNAVLLIVGNIDPTEAFKAAEKNFGGWTPRAGATAEGWAGAVKTPAMPTNPFKIYIVNDEKKTQSETEFTCRLNYGGEAERPAVSVLGSALSDATFTTLRVKEALSYSPYAYTQIDDDGSATLSFSSLALNKGVGRTIQFFLEATKQVERGELAPDTVKLHKLRLAREGGLMSQSIDQMIGTLTGPIRRGEKNWDAINKAGDNLAAVKPEQLTALVKGCTEHGVVMTYGPASVITPQLDALGYTYEVIDWEKRGDELLKAYDAKAYDKEQKAKAKKKAKEEKEKAKEAKKGGGTPTEPAPAEPAPAAPGVARTED